MCQYFADILHCTDNATCHTFGLCNPDTLLCECQSGYHGDGKQSCTDIDECANKTDNCHEHATCTNLEGSFECECKDGYYGDGVLCLGK